MAFYEPKNARSALLPITLIHLFAGMGIIEYSFGNPRPIFSFIYSSVIFTFYAMCGYYAYMHNSRLFWESSPFSNAFYTLFYGLTIIIIGWWILLSIIYSKERSRCIGTLEEIDRIMEEMGIVRSYRPLLVAQIRQFGSVVLMSILIMNCLPIDSKELSGIPWIANVISSWIVFLYPLVPITSYEIMFCNFDAMITGSFKDLNSLLESLRFMILCHSHDKKNNSIQVDVVSREKKELYMLYSIRKIYARLARLAKDWNQINGVFIVCDIVVSIFIFTADTFIVYDRLYQREITSILDDRIIMQCSLLMSFLFGKVFLVTSSAVSLMSETQRTSGIISEHLHPIASLRSEVRTFSMQLIQNPLKLSVCKIMPLDYSVFREIFFLVLGYVIVLIQFSDTRQTNQKKL